MRPARTRGKMPGTAMTMTKVPATGCNRSAGNGTPRSAAFLSPSALRARVSGGLTSPPPPG